MRAGALTREGPGVRGQGQNRVRLTAETCLPPFGEQVALSRYDIRNQEDTIPHATVLYSDPWPLTPDPSRVSALATSRMIVFKSREGV